MSSEHVTRLLGADGDADAMKLQLGVDGDARVRDPKWVGVDGGTPWVSGLVGHFVQTWSDSELLSHSAVLRL